MPEYMTAIFLGRAPTGPRSGEEGRNSTSDITGRLPLPMMKSFTQQAMSRDPHEGYVDANCKVHGVDNLLIAGSSVFTTSGYANPTLTIIALAARLADHLAGAAI